MNDTYSRSQAEVSVTTTSSDSPQRYSEVTSPENRLAGKRQGRRKRPPPPAGHLGTELASQDGRVDAWNRVKVRSCGASLQPQPLSSHLCQRTRSSLLKLSEFFTSFSFFCNWKHPDGSHWDLGVKLQIQGP